MITINETALAAWLLCCQRNYDHHDPFLTYADLLTFCDSQVERRLEFINEAERASVELSKFLLKKPNVFSKALNLNP